MEKKVTFTDRLKNLSVGKKLTAGFLAVVAVALLITAVGVSGFHDIRENLKLQKMTVDMVIDLGDARLNRTLLQYTGNSEYAEKNMVAVGKIQAKLQDLDRAEMPEEGRVKRTAATRIFSRYLEALAAFTSAQEKAQANLTTADLTELTRIRDALSLSSQNGTLSPEQALVEMKIGNDLTTLIYSVQAFLLHPDQEGINGIASTAGRISANHSTLMAMSSVTSDGVIRSLPSRIATIRPLLTSYLALSEDKALRSKALAGVSGELRTAITDMFIYQQERSAETVSRARLVMLSSALAGVIFALFTAWWITRNITLPLRETLEAANRISAGDLTQTISTRRQDEPGLLLQSVGVMSQNLRLIITNVREGVDSVARASAEIAAGNTDLSSRTEQQSAAVVQTAASMEQLTSTVTQTAGNAREASRLAQEASDNAGQGGDIVNDVIRTMSEISQSSARITDIIGVINGIAFQTNILALNAAVEAARAGEQGRGFAVVAGEVRNLAQRSSTAAKEIAMLINESGVKVADGSRLVSRAGETMTGIVSSVKTVREIMAEIATASEEQSRGIQQISLAMSEMDTTTQQNAALVEESSAAANSLEDQARQLEETVAVFRTGT
ncbi:methyl-accepting chemotaxis protein (plasmid) [Erwinia rhapontici]|uniref:methyl-accepting chemotaxis protein n=1 Tax=Erwinia rhapontici TaxID=55212 RepID=UPI001BB5DFC5|nr:methyl-accepting chemotaxis protein [Erwinia rhapontici]BCQ42424.1 methyl-accepting chemotaxis protein [Erwinia rhapontici]